MAGPEEGWARVGAGGMGWGKRREENGGGARLAPDLGHLSAEDRAPGSGSSETSGCATAEAAGRLP